jgi:hypothetical protein
MLPFEAAGVPDLARGNISRGEHRFVRHALVNRDSNLSLSGSERGALCARQQPAVGLAQNELEIADGWRGAASREPSSGSPLRRPAPGIPSAVRRSRPDHRRHRSAPGRRRSPLPGRADRSGATSGRRMASSWVLAWIRSNGRACSCGSWIGYR